MKKTKHNNVFVDRNKLFTVNADTGNSVYGERLFNFDNQEYRQWDQRRSKLGASISKGIFLPDFKKNDVWLYLGAASGTTVSHVSDILTEGFVFGIEFSPRVLRDLYFLSEKRKNIAPILADASKPKEYLNLISGVDIVFQDIAQKNQVEIFKKNMDLFLKKDGYGIFSCKSRSIDVSKKPRDVFKVVEKQLREYFTIVDWKTLEPYEIDHAVFVCKK